MTSAPASTYRLQISPDFTLDDAAAVVPYLADLGVGAVYLSPILTSTTGSDHGYDTVEPAAVDPQRGGDAGWAALQRAVRDAGLPIVIDIVPNHLGISAPAENRYWWDVLTHGPDSTYASWCDIDWTRGRVLVPILGDDPTLSLDGDELRYFEHRFPIAPGTEGGTPAEVHARQHYELVHWERGNTELNYRRFFAVTTLAGVRQEDPAVFAGTHGRIAELVADGVVGLRVDHPDGLVDPADYLAKLRALAPDAWITVEKILEPGEQLPSWPVAGTTGYDALREVSGLFVDPSSETALTALYEELTGDTRTIADHVVEGKRMVTRDLLPAEVSRIAALVPDVPDADQVIAEAAVAFDVYRSYLPDGVAHLDDALAQVLTVHPGLADAVTALRPRLADGDDEVGRRFQQLSGATMAKGTEDTAFYRYSRFVALNEVGGDPGRFGVEPAEFHAAAAAREHDWPTSMTTLSTHDTKRGEDVRARLAVLSELPAEWAGFVRAAWRLAPIAEPTIAYLLWQVVAGVGLINRQRLHAYAEKAMREAAVATTWTAPDQAFEAAVHAAVDQAYDDPELARLVTDLHARLDVPAWSNSLGQKLVQLAMPGVPDVYQGTELWEDSLVDPDNRRLIDYDVRRDALGRTSPAITADGAAKQWVVRQTLTARRDRAELFTGYQPLTADGPAADHLVAFDRSGATVLATRLPVGLAAQGGWGDTSVVLPAARDALTGREIGGGPTRVADVLLDYPVALLLV
ncbi:MAG: malto-oligosyltrehalose synthase [Propionibacteriaceae bacterium]